MRQCKFLHALLWAALLGMRPAAGFAQTHEAGGIVALGYEKKIVKGLDFNLGGELRFDQNFMAFDRFKLSAGLDYSFLKKKRLKISVRGYYLLANKSDFFENRGRVSAAVTYTEKFNQFRLSYRVRVQTTFYDESRSEHKFNPKTYLRNRLQLEYNFFAKPMKIYASTEFFLRLYQKNRCFIDNFRTELGWSYKFSQGSAVGLFLRADNEIQVKNPSNVYSLGITYNFKH